MTQSAYANSIVNSMLGWLKGFANWVLKLFNLAGRGGVSPLGWLADNWLNLLIFFIVVGIVLDWLVWMMRWRPYWVWFRKKRILIEDEDFFAGEELVDSGLYDKRIFGDELRPDKRRPARKRPADPDEDEFVVASTVVRRTPPRESRDPSERRARRADETPSRRTGDRRRPTSKPPKAAKTPSKARPARKRPAPAEDPFNVETTDPSASSFWEEDVFNVSDLPGEDDPSVYAPASNDKRNDSDDALL